MATTLTPKTMIAHAPQASPVPGQGPFLTGAPLPKAGSVMSVNTGQWRGIGALNYGYQWFVDGTAAYASATNASYSISAANSNKWLTCRVSCGNATYGTQWRDVKTGTIMA